MKRITVSITVFVMVLLAACGNSAEKTQINTNADVQTQAGSSKNENLEQKVETEESDARQTEEFVEPAADDFEYYYDEALEGIVISEYKGKSEAIQFPAEIDGVPVKKIDSRVIYDFIKVRKITIPDSVTEIGINAFRQVVNLTEITIPDSVTVIGGGAFAVCHGLKEIAIPDGVTEIGDGTFMECISLTEITIPDSVTKIGAYAFFKCTSLTEITIPDSVTEIGECAFVDCTSLTKITIPDNVYIARGSFQSCNDLTVTYKGQEYTYESGTDWWE